jgi:hypothetical protein
LEFAVFTAHSPINNKEFHMLRGSRLGAGAFFAFLLGGVVMAEDAMSWVGKPAPDAEVVAVGPDGKEGKVKLSSFQGKKNVVLAFYPKAMTPG